MLETGCMKGYRDESVRLQVVHLVHLIGALNLAFLTFFCNAVAILYVLCCSRGV